MRKIFKIAFCIILLPTYPMIVYTCSIFGVVFVGAFLGMLMFGISFLFDKKEEDKKEFVDCLWMFCMPFYVPINWAIKWINGKATISGNP